MDKTVRLICDFITTLVLVAFIGSVVAFATIGDVGFYNGYIANESVSDIVKDEVDKAVNDVSNQTGIEKSAIDYAINKNVDLDSIKYAIMPSVFSGIRPNVVKTKNIDEGLLSGIVSYYEINGIEYDTNALNTCVDTLCERINDIVQVDNISQLSQGVKFVNRYAKAIAVASIVILVVLVNRLFALNYGRTKTFAHIGSVLISAGCCFITTFLMNTLLHFTTRLGLTSNEIVIGATSDGTDRYFKLLAIIGAALILLGTIATRYVYDYYVRKHSYRMQEVMINEKIRNDAINASESIENKDNLENGDN